MLAVPERLSLDDAEAVTSRVFDRKSLTASVRQLSAVTNLRGAWAIARQWIMIALAIAFVVQVDRWWAWVLAAVIISTRQHALLSLVHEASHYHLFTNRAANDFVADVLCAFPTNITTAGYRKEHVEHHRFVNTPQDPYWRTAQRDHAWMFPRTRWGTARVLLGDMVGVFTASHMKIIIPWSYSGRLSGKGGPPVSRAEHVRYALFLVALIAGLTLAGGWLHYLLLWSLPSLTLMMIAFRIRAVVEHPFTPATQDETHETRDVEAPTWFERFFIAPFNAGYHLSHHLFPSVPYYHLPELHQRLKQTGLYRPGENHFRTYLQGQDSAWKFLTSAPKD
ncbi:fatty acid desaturase [Corallococcus sp. CA053C]|uniref:fatty acid desaturase family protein n=1 Tax=Corallococcus sp. CA053C TaxID=2316732 RepID=UPI000E9FFADE|nr:fatty acid desaturase family protein [Corallococcus sp. CA053C]RKG98818.1 fatty acid desaturase [Corallococcus sp. CA053C]